MASVPQLRLCWSTSNVMSFLCWFEYYASDEEQAVVGDAVYVVDHEWAFGQTPNTFVLRYRDGMSAFMRHRPCNERPCPRCEAGRGGWHFRWTDARWTPRVSLALSINPMQHHRLAGLAWPWGILQPPRQQGPAIPLPPPPVDPAVRTSAGASLAPALSPAAAAAEARSARRIVEDSELAMQLGDWMPFSESESEDSEPDSEERAVLAVMAAAILEQRLEAAAEQSAPAGPSAAPAA